ncbi:hypothetical protein KFL_005900060 [Klebsormidium nitens]|uniref:Uncharacterized protein n=1 Tax=Klebsormidium nitens TaxID=105231 RepID=A0A1Y1IGM9_KLENI|nr:hypothetical protein KFL_005900060 [Klebsormidium nitens]|eukprot:GAQ90020.1 hypothetical protein KFL_005900060 [Klebsormidium nitens]
MASFWSASFAACVFCLLAGDYLQIWQRSGLGSTLQGFFPEGKGSFAKETQGLQGTMNQSNNIVHKDHQLAFAPDQSAESCKLEAGHEFASGLIVQGACTCLPGLECTLHIRSFLEEHWDTDDKMAQELLVVFEGPARAIARLEPDNKNSAFAAWRARYQIWDPGSYRVSVQAGCTARSQSVILATFGVQVSGFEGLGTRPRPTPCDFGQHGRWLLDQPSKDYRWIPFPCAPPLVNTETFPQEIRRRGYGRIVFIGDSHQRMLYMHLKFLLDGRAIVADYDRHVDFTSTINEGDPESELQLRFYWVDGIYRNGQDGCRNRGRYSRREDSFPEIAASDDSIFVLDAGAWSATFCDRPLQAYTRHILPFIDWGASLVRGNSTLVWRTAPPSVWFCERKNGILHHFNEITSHLLSGRIPEVKVFDSWQIEAPRFRDADPISHYSWTEPNANGNGTLVMAGPVGKAVVHAFMTWVLENHN